MPTNSHRQNWEMAREEKIMEGLQLCFCQVIERLWWQVLVDLKLYYARAVRRLRLVQSTQCQVKSNSKIDIEGLTAEIAFTFGHFIPKVSICWRCNWAQDVDKQSNKSFSLFFCYSFGLSFLTDKKGEDFEMMPKNMIHITFSRFNTDGMRCTERSSRRTKGEADDNY